MNRKRLLWLVCAGCVLALGIWFVTPLAARDAAGQPVGRDVTMTGKVVDLHCLMTGEYPSADHAKCAADCIRAGVPAALETPTGVVLLGQGMKSASTLLAPLAFEEVEIKGKLYEKHGVKYVDIASATKVAGKSMPGTDWEGEGEEEE